MSKLPQQEGDRVTLHDKPGRIGTIVDINHSPDRPTISCIVLWDNNGVKGAYWLSQLRLAPREHVHHIMDERVSNERFTPTRPENVGVSYCGVEFGQEWVFRSVDHAVNTVRAGSHMQACEACVLTAIQLLKEATE